MTSSEPLRSPGVRFPPPLLFVAGLVIGWALDRFALALPLARAVSGHTLAIGLGLVIIGLLLAAWGIITFRRVGTAIIPHHRATRIVAEGPYRFTRNPMYTGMTIAYLGGAVLLGTWWPVVLLPIVLVMLVRFVVRREERYLSDAFGVEYAEYRARVRRWL